MRGAVVLAVLLAGGVARADAAGERQAREHYTRAQQAFDAVDYELALLEFQRAYELTPYPAIEYKIALCHDQLGHTAQALEAYRVYLAADPKTTRRRGIEARIEKLRGAADTAPPSRAAEPVEVPSPAAPPPETPPAIAPTAVVPAATAPSLPPVERHATPLYKKWWLWTVLGVVVAGAAVGGALAATTPRDASIPSGAIPIHFSSVSTP